MHTAAFVNARRKEFLYFPNNLPRVGRFMIKKKTTSAVENRIALLMVVVKCDYNLRRGVDVEINLYQSTKVLFISVPCNL